MITKIKVVKQKIPSEYLQCDDIPLAPKDIKMQSEAAEYSVKLYDVLEGCKMKMENIRGFMDGEK